jgi:hypothetical protein
MAFCVAESFEAVPLYDDAFRLYDLKAVGS